MKIKTAFAGLFVLVASSVLVFPGEPPVDPQPQEKSQPEARTDFESIKFFLGTWKGLATITVNGKINIVHFDAIFTLAPDGKSIYEDEIIVHPEFGTLKRQDVWSYNEKTGKIRVIRTNYDGKIHIYAGSWLTPNHFRYQTEEALSMGAFVETIDFHYYDKNRVDAYLRATLNGEIVETDTGYFSREEKPLPPLLEK